jgi:hypothetical protein
MGYACSERVVESLGCLIELWFFVRWAGVGDWERVFGG